MSLILDACCSLLLYLLIAYSFQILYSVSKALYLTHAASITIGAYAVYGVSTVLETPLWLSVPISVFICDTVIIGLYKWIYMPLQKKETASWQLMIASLGLYVVLQNIVSIIWGDGLQSFRTWEIQVGHHLLGTYVTKVQFVILSSSISLLVLTWLFMEKTNAGRLVKVVASNIELSNMLGLPKKKAEKWSVFIGTSLAAFTGILIGADYSLTPSMGFNWLLYAVIAMIIGGMDKMRHLFMGALLLAAAQHVTAYYLDSKWMNAIAYIILIVFLAFRPVGFSGKQIKKSSL